MNFLPISTHQSTRQSRSCTAQVRAVFRVRAVHDSSEAGSCLECSATGPQISGKNWGCLKIWKTIFIVYHFPDLNWIRLGPSPRLRQTPKTWNGLGCMLLMSMHVACQTAPLPPAAFWVSPESGVVGASEVSDFSDVQFCCEPKSKLRWSQTAALQ